MSRQNKSAKGIGLRRKLINSPLKIDRNCLRFLRIIDPQVAGRHGKFLISPFRHRIAAKPWLTCKLRWLIARQSEFSPRLCLNRFFFSVIKRKLLSAGTEKTFRLRQLPTTFETLITQNWYFSRAKAKAWLRGFEHILVGVTCTNNVLALLLSWLVSQLAFSAHQKKNVFSKPIIYQIPSVLTIA